MCEKGQKIKRVGAREDFWEDSLWNELENSLLQILVVVANTKVRCFRTEVEKGSMTIAIIRGLFGPKLQINFKKSTIQKVRFLYDCKYQQKGNG